jgi:hypothetical protein
LHRCFANQHRKTGDGVPAAIRVLAALKAVLVLQVKSKG